MANSWFSIDKAGLAAILERRGKFFALAELISNSWDSGATQVDVTLEPIPGQSWTALTVEDNGEGFADLSHANTLFARSSRAGDAEKRGRFNLGEKLVLACCRTATIETVGGGIEFRDDGTIKRLHPQRERGTLFTAEIRMTRDELAECLDGMKRLIPPVDTSLNGAKLDRPDSVACFAVKLPTEIADADGMIRRTVRMADVEVYEANGPGEILELGIPVVETENGYRVNVLQKVPLNMERDNVTPGFLKSIQAALLNNIHDALTPEAAAQPWVQEAAGDSRASADAVKAVVKARFGERAVIATPGDPMANAQAEAAGFTVIPGGSLSSDAWANIRKHSILMPTSKVFPTPPAEAIAARAEQACPLCGK